MRKQGYKSRDRPVNHTLAASEVKNSSVKALVAYLLTYSMVKSPTWEANWFAASQEIPRISWNPKVHYRTHKRAPHVSILGQPNPSIYPHPTSWKSILILSTHLCLGLPSGLVPSGFITNTLYTPPRLTHTRHMPIPSHSFVGMLVNINKH